MKRAPFLTNLTLDLRHAGQGILLAAGVAVVAGSASALFLWSLEWAIRTQWQRPELLWGLPLAGFVVGWIYYQFGKGSDAGNNLLIDEIHDSERLVPARMAPLVLLGTLVTHLFGGSAGREGTAVQMGGGLAALMARALSVGVENRRLMLRCGMAAGFSSVFGTPLTGAVFAMEVLVVGRMQYHALIPVLVAAVVGDATCALWGIHHTVYHLPMGNVETTETSGHLILLGKVVLAAVFFGLAARFFSELTHAVQRGFGRWISYPPLRPAIGGILLIGLVYLTGTRDYLGLGVNAPPGGTASIMSSFEADGAGAWSWFWKTIFTVVTLGSGFKGGEVTPLFFVGATLGHVVGWLLQEPVALFAAMGFLAVFAGASNTPLACTVMGVELFGGQFAIHYALACFVAYACSGHTGIYLAQRLGVAKRRRTHAESLERPLRERFR